MSEIHHDNPASEEPFRMPVTDSLDLHTFRPHEVKDLVEDYLNECVRIGFREVRIIHGKGLGSRNREPVLKNTLHKLLPRREDVLAFCQAPAAHGGSGALLILLKKRV